ncbi:hypothetical protein [Microbulbifer elongatus]|uniref:hypothetical protein n=1 Tax=Microbulbifer elongatus TaxID=86173 RepID=UPI001E5CD67F|nr:hypothetical protein [Microbulbifer elongatus]
MDKVNLDGQNLIFLSPDDVSSILETKSFEGFSLFHYDILAQALQEYREYTGVEIALMGARGRYQLICFVRVSGERYRVHIEDVICEHCDKRGGISGTPGVWDLYLFCEDPHAVHSNAMALPVKKCIHCSGLLSRRHKIWFEHEQSS